MPPIVSPILLNQILMDGFAPASAAARQYSPLPRRVSRKVIGNFANFGPKAISYAESLSSTGYTTLPNYPFAHKSPTSESDLHKALIELSEIALTFSSPDCSLTNSVPEVDTHSDMTPPTDSTTSLAPVSISGSTTPSARSSSNLESPLTETTSISRWQPPIAQCDSDTQPEPFLAPVSKYIRRYPPPVDSLKIARKRQASEATGESMFISRPLKKSRTSASCLRRLGQRILKKVKW